jgi:uncharacterized cofD-like protein
MPVKDTLDAIARADLITMGPGSLFTSVIPNLLVMGIPKAIRQSPALKACFVNLMSQPGETINFSASDHVAAIREHAGEKILDYVIVSSSRIPLSVRRNYAAQNAAPVENDCDVLRGMGLEVLEADLLVKGPLLRRGKVRHSPEAIATVTMDLAMQGRKRRG